jgi:hypothetical protein
MRLLIASTAIALLAGCATAVKHSDAPMSRYDKNTKYSVEPRPDGFGVSVYYSRYQFVPESDAVAMACKQALTSIAHEYAAKQRREIEQVNEQTVRLSMGRNGLSGITSCSAYASAKWKSGSH